MEILSESGRKTKRNLLFFCAVSWALAAGGVWPAGYDVQSIGIAGLGLETSVGFVLLALAVLQGYNLIAFIIYVFFQNATTKVEKIQRSEGYHAPIPDVLRKYNYDMSRFDLLAAYLLEPWEMWVPPFAGVLGLIGTGAAYWRLFPAAA